MPYNGPYPHYRFPAKLLLEIIRSMFLGKTRNFYDDSQTALSANKTIAISGILHIPTGKPFLLTLNHYSRPGFLIIWAAIAIAAYLPCPSLWVMTSAWTKRTGGIDAIRTWLTRRVLMRMAEMYGFVAMPPMPPVPKEQTERAIGIRTLMRAIHNHPEKALCLAPQGQDFTDDMLGAPPLGTGKMIVLLSRYFNKILPVGVFEEDGRLVIHFGKPYQLAEILTLEDSDEQIAWRVMHQIALCLPDGIDKIYPFPQKEK